MTAVRRVFLKLLGVVYLIAFASLGVQIEGLVGSHGILPAAELLREVRATTGAERYWLLPTLCWWNDSDGFLKLLCWAGAALAVLLILDLAPVLILALLWVFYLSLASVGQIFLGYQWDALLLETGLVAILLAPLRLRPGAADSGPPAAASIFLLRFLLFRLMFSSGAVKLLSGDETWRSLSALRVHYETQPIPTWTAWYMHQLPAWFQTLSCAAMLAIELLVPFLILGPRRVRLCAFWPLVGLQLLIAATGNYAFFNLLALALCVLLLDDAALPERLRRGARSTNGTDRSWPKAILWPVAAVILSVSASRLLLTLGVRPPTSALSLTRLLAPLSSINSYGLFAVMTTSRPEILVEGSDDGVSFRPYSFKWKPGDLQRAPPFVAPHQPRLDWQMWFAALGSCESNAWFIRFLLRLHEGSPEVLALLAENPFPDAPPRILRASLYDYRFTRLGEGSAWWRREPKGLYCPDLETGPESP